MFDKNVEIDVPCPGCGFKKKFKIKELEGNLEYVCDSCKKTINLDASKFAKVLKDSEKKLDTFKKTIKNLNIKLKL